MRGTIAVAAAMVVALAGGCGGDDGEQSEAATGTAGSSGEAPDTEGSSSDEGPDSMGTSSSGGLDETFGCDLQTYYPDADEDGYGDDEYPVEACLQPPAHIPTGGDCDDSNPDVNPETPEVCDLADNDCDGLADEPSEGLTSCEGCTLGERDGHAYYYCPMTMGWDAARTFCMQWGADLVKLDDQAEQDFLLGEPLPAAAVVYLGLSDIEIEGTFVWTDGSAPSFTNWNTGEPNDALDGEDCGQMAVPAGTWNDIACATAGAFVCEAAPQ